jgi:hypothetical protein
MVAPVIGPPLSEWSVSLSFGDSLPVADPVDQLPRVIGALDFFDRPAHDHPAEDIFEQVQRPGSDCSDT